MVTLCGEFVGLASAALFHPVILAFARSFMLRRGSFEHISSKDCFEPDLSTMRGLRTQASIDHLCTWGWWLASRAIWS